MILGVEVVVVLKVGLRLQTTYLDMITVIAGDFRPIQQLAKVHGNTLYY